MASLADWIKSQASDYGQLFNNNPKMDATKQFGNKLKNNVTQGLENLVPPSFSNVQEAQSPEYNKKLTDYALGNGMGMSGMATAIKAYHGSPVNFNKFDMSKIGSGEGAQAYGHGLYLAEHPKVAEEYRDRLSDFGSPYTYEWNGETFNQESGINPIKHALQSIYHQGKASSLKMAKSVLKDALNQEPYALEMGGVDYADKLLNTVKTANKKDIKATQGQIYETSIQWPDAVREATDPLGVHHLIDYDAPFNQQPESIQKLLQSTYDDVYKSRSATRQRLNEKFANNNKVSPVNKEMSPITGQQIYKRLAGDLGSTTEASKKLNEMGIPGIKYLDKGSRKASGTSNYVMFGDEYLQITNRAGSLAQLLRGK